LPLSGCGDKIAARDGATRGRCVPEMKERPVMTSRPHASPSAHQPLAGIRVVEIGSSVAAPYAGWILAALGADVVKVENPEGGDDSRQWGRLFPDGRSSYYLALNRDKRGVTIDLKDPAELGWLRRYCVTEADVVIQNMRPGKIASYGLDAATLCVANPRLVYCNMGAFGAVGPMRDRPGYDPLMQAFGGLMSVTGEDERPPVRVGVSIVDMGTGMWTVIGVLSALFRRSGTGRGCIIDTSLYESSVAWVALQAAMVQVDGREPERCGSGARGIAPYQAYLCADGYLVIGAPNDRLFARLAQVLGHPEWPQDARFSSNQNRYANLAGLNALMEPILLADTRDGWMARLDAAGVPCAPVRRLTEMLADPQTAALGIVQDLDGRPPRLMGLPVSFDGERPPMRQHAPAMGEHNAELKRPITQV